MGSYAGPIIGPRPQRGFIGPSNDASTSGRKEHAESGNTDTMLKLNICNHTHPVWRVMQPVGAGLQNIGNTCYMNSVLQCLAHAPPLGNLLIRSESHPYGLHGFPCPLSPSACTACMIEVQLRDQLAGRGQIIRPTMLVTHLDQFSTTFVRGRQEDSHELLISVIESLERDIHKAYARSIGSIKAPKGFRSLPEEVFMGRTVSQVVCRSCGHISCTHEPFAALSLEIGKQIGSVEDAMRHFTAAEMLDGDNKYKCDKCKRLVPARKQLAIDDDPNLLAIHLKRFDAAGFGTKVSRHISFLDKMDLSPFSSEQLFQGTTPLNSPPVRGHYILWGVLVHQGGTLHSGHYLAYVRDSSGGWHCANDSFVSPVSSSHVLSQQAYILFYGRTAIKAMAPIPKPAPSEGSEVSGADHMNSGAHGTNGTNGSMGKANGSNGSHGANGSHGPHGSAAAGVAGAPPSLLPRSVMPRPSSQGQANGQLSSSSQGHANGQLSTSSATVTCLAATASKKVTLPVMNVTVLAGSSKVTTLAGTSNRVTLQPVSSRNSQQQQQQKQKQQQQQQQHKHLSAEDQQQQDQQRQHERLSTERQQQQQHMHSPTQQQQQQKLPSTELLEQNQHKRSSTEQQQRMHSSTQQQQQQQHKRPSTELQEQQQQHKHSSAEQQQQQQQHKHSSSEQQQQQLHKRKHSSTGQTECKRVSTELSSAPESSRLGPPPSSQSSSSHPVAGPHSASPVTPATEPAAAAAAAAAAVEKITRASNPVAAATAAAAPTYVKQPRTESDYSANLAVAKSDNPHKWEAMRADLKRKFLQAGRGVSTSPSSSGSYVDTLRGKLEELKRSGADLGQVMSSSGVGSELRSSMKKSFVQIAGAQSAVVEMSAFLRSQLDQQERQGKGA